MANLWTGNVNTNGVYQKLSELSEITFTTDTKYVIQIQNLAYVREGTVGEGILINTTDPFEYQAGEEDLYIMTPTFGCVVNISD